MVDEQKEEQPADNIGEGNKPGSPDKIERAELAVKRMEEAEAKLNATIAKLEELEANRLLGGTAGGHIEAKLETADEKWAKEAKIRYAGTGMCPC